MNDKRVLLITGANQGVGFEAAKEIGSNGLAVQLDVTDRVQLTRRQNEFRASLVTLTFLCRMPEFSRTGWHT